MLFSIQVNEFVLKRNLLVNQRNSYSSSATDLFKPFRLVEVYRAHMSDPCELDKFSQQLQNADLMTPEEFEQYWDELEKSKMVKHQNRHKKR